MIFSNEDKMIIQNYFEYIELVGLENLEELSIQKIIIHPENHYSSVKCLLKKSRETGSMDSRHGSRQPRTVSTKKKHDFERRVGLVTGRAYQKISLQFHGMM